MNFMNLLSGTVFNENGALIIVFLVLAAALAAFDFFRKKSKKNKAMEALNGLQRGNSVVLINGMTGTIASVYDDAVEIDLSAASRARFMKWAVSEIDGKKVQ